MFTKEGELVATCVQEVHDKHDAEHWREADRCMQGVVRLKENNRTKDMSSKL